MYMFNEVYGYKRITKEFKLIKKTCALSKKSVFEELKKNLS